MVNHEIGNLADLILRKLLPATGVIWALRAQSWKESRKMSSRGLSAPGPKKSQTESKKSQNRLFFNYFDSFSTPFSTFWAPGPRGPGNSFSELFFKLWARRAQMTPVAGPGNPKSHRSNCYVNWPLDSSRGMKSEISSTRENVRDVIT